MDLPPRSRLITSFKVQQDALTDPKRRPSAFTYMCVFSSLSILHVGPIIKKKSVCGPNSTRSRVIRSSPCWLSTPSDNTAIHRLTDGNHLSGREMCLGAEEEAGWVSSKPPKNPREDRRALLTSVLLQTTQTSGPWLLTEEILKEEQKHSLSVINMRRHHLKDARWGSNEHEITWQHAEGKKVENPARLPLAAVYQHITASIFLSHECHHSNGH